MGARVAANYDDAGVSGAFYATRPGLQSALALIEEGRADLLIVANVSRLSRDSEHQGAIVKRVKRAGGRIVFCDMTFEETPEGELSFGIMGQFAQFERGLIRSRTMNGRKKRADEGIQTARTFSPHGYYIPTHTDVLKGLYPFDAVGKYQVVEHEAVFVRDMFARCAAGDSLRAICRYLTEAAPTPRRGAKWYVTTVRLILQNPVYYGLGAYGRTETFTDEKRKTERGFKKCTYHRKRDAAQWQTFAVPPIVDEATFAACQERLNGNKSRLGGNPGRRYLLTGIGVCGNCGTALTGYKANKGGDEKYHYYRCRTANTWKAEKPTDCTECAVRLIDLESLVLTGFLEVAAKPEFIARAVEAYRADRRRPAPTEADAARIEGELTALDRRERATISAQIAGIAAGARPEFYTSEFEEIARLRAALLAQKKAHTPTQTPRSGADPDKVADIMSRALSDLADVLQSEEITVAEKHALLTRVVTKVVPHTEHKPGARTKLKAVTVYTRPPRPLPGLSLETGYKFSAYCSQNFSTLPTLRTFSA